jgi:O-antigen/teichoic acid export membrane protein
MLNILNTNKTKITSITNLLSKILQVMLLIYSVHKASFYFSRNEITIWLTTTSLIGVFLFFDFGLSSNLLHSISHTNTKNIKKLKGIIATGLFTSFLLALIITISFLILANFLHHLPTFKKIPQEEIIQIKNIVYTYIFIFGFHFIYIALEKIYLGIGKGYQAYTLSILSVIFSAPLVFFVTEENMSINYMILSTFGVQTLFGLMLLIPLLNNKLIDSKSIKLIKKDQLVKVFKGSQKFFLINSGNLLSSGIDIYLIIFLLGLSETANYNISLRLFQIIIFPLTAINIPLWKKFAEINQSNDHEKADHLIKKIIYFSILFFAFITTFILIFGYKVTSIWTSGLISVSTLFLFAYSIRVLSECMSNLFISYLGGINRLDILIKFNCFILLLLFPIKVITLKYLGVQAMLFVFSILYILYFSYLLYRLKRTRQLISKY